MTELLLFWFADVGSIHSRGALLFLGFKFDKDTVLEQEEFTRLPWIHHPQGRPMET